MNTFDVMEDDGITQFSVQADSIDKAQLAALNELGFTVEDNENGEYALVRSDEGIIENTVMSSSCYSAAGVFLNSMGYVIAENQLA